MRRVSVLLIIDGHSIPTDCGTRAVVLIEARRFSVQGDRLVQQLIARSSLYLDRQMIPGITDRVACHTGGYPALVEVVPNIPLIAAGNAALVAPDESEIVEELVHVELDCLRRSKIASPEIHVVREAMQRRNNGMVRI